MNVFLREPTRADEERDPSSVTLLGTGLRAAKQIAFGDNAENGALTVRHGQAADTVLQHQQRRYSIVASGRTVTTKDVIRSAALMRRLPLRCKFIPQ